MAAPTQKTGLVWILFGFCFLNHFHLELGVKLDGLTIPSASAKHAEILQERGS